VSLGEVMHAAQRLRARQSAPEVDPLPPHCSDLSPVDRASEE
jgi:hypothetical protein